MNLPIELWFIIFLELDFFDVLSLRRTNRFFAKLLEQEEVATILLKKWFPSLVKRNEGGALGPSPFRLKYRANVAHAIAMGEPWAVKQLEGISNWFFRQGYLFWRAERLYYINFTDPDFVKTGLSFRTLIPPDLTPEQVARDTRSMRLLEFSDDVLIYYWVGRIIAFNIETKESLISKLSPEPRFVRLTKDYMCWGLLIDDPLFPDDRRIWAISLYDLHEKRMITTNAILRGTHRWRLDRDISFEMLQDCLWIVSFEDVIVHGNEVNPNTHYLVWRIELSSPPEVNLPCPFKIPRVAQFDGVFDTRTPALRIELDFGGEHVEATECPAVIGAARKNIKGYSQTISLASLEELQHPIQEDDIGPVVKTITHPGLVETFQLQFKHYDCYSDTFWQLFLYGDKLVLRAISKSQAFGVKYKLLTILQPGYKVMHAMIDSRILVVQVRRNELEKLYLFFFDPSHGKNYQINLASEVAKAA